MKNEKQTNRTSDRWVDDSDFIGPFVFGASIYKGNLTIFVF